MERVTQPQGLAAGQKRWPASARWPSSTPIIETCRTGSAKRSAWIVLAAVMALALAGTLVAVFSGSAHPVVAAAPLLDPPCPLPTQEPLWVDPVTSPTGQFTQVVTVRLGNGEAVTVTAESGRFATVGDFDAYFHPASVTVALLPNTVHHLEVFGRVRVVEHDGCVYGGYTLSTWQDKNGAPLVIEQRADLTHTVYFPVIMCH